jgi:hypothetical protein
MTTASGRPDRYRHYQGDSEGWGGTTNRGDRLNVIARSENGVDDLMTDTRHEQHQAAATFHRGEV